MADQLRAPDISDSAEPGIAVAREAAEEMAEATRLARRSIRESLGVIAEGLGCMPTLLDHLDIAQRRLRELEAENARLRSELAEARDEAERLRSVLASDTPFKIVSQLQDERDRARAKALEEAAAIFDRRAAELKKRIDRRATTAFDGGHVAHEAAVADAALIRALAQPEPGEQPLSSPADQS